MKLTRKQFLRQGIFSLGSSVLELATGLRGEPAAVPVEQEEPELQPRPDMVAVPVGSLCLARNCGCLACVERCEADAITLVPGKGIVIDPALCTGCGNCCYLCPVTPKAVALTARELPPAPRSSTLETTA
ncbi:hypothetical protein [Geomonas sp.]|uniref:hypothetical protein n=1 Tax=Geomonas sp. TaxID=2651584 RepID=UPI002B4A42EB|nr:hypothetical protein [Geomonas sp.]HJV33607.1 hypothetical protein [Geomonas sp.]